MDVRHSELFPDACVLLPPRSVYADFGRYEVTAPAGTTHVRVSMTAVGGQGENFGGNAAFAHIKAKASPGEVFELQVGQPAQSGALGDSWFRRKATGETICYADRGRGTGGVQGSAVKSIGDIKRSGVAGSGPASDSSDVAPLGYGGRPAGTDGRVAPAPGGGGQGALFPYEDVRHPAGQGRQTVEFYAGDPGIGY